jgi:hypothetical protein
LQAHKAAVRSAGAGGSGSLLIGGSAAMSAAGNLLYDSLTVRGARLFKWSEPLMFVRRIE